MNSVRNFAIKAALASCILAGVALVSFAPAANAVSYSTSGFSLTGLGDTINSSYDWLTGTSQSGAIVDGQTINLNLLSFTAGVNAIVPQDYNGVYSITQMMTIGSTSQPISIPFNLSISYSDTLTILPTTFSFTEAGSLWQVAVNGLTLGPNSGGTISQMLTAQVIDPPSQAPLPAALPLFASGLGGMALFSWWRKRKRVGAAGVG